jgi:hypothetical protein
VPQVVIDKGIKELTITDKNGKTGATTTLTDASSV